MTLEVLTKAVNDHGEAIKSFRTKVETDLRGLSEQTAENGARLLDLEQRAAQPRGEGGPIGGAPTNPFGALFRHERLNQFRDGLPSTGRIELKAGLPEITKALTSLQGSGATPAAGYPVEPQRFAGVYENPLRPLRLLDVLRRITVSSNTFEFARMSGDAVNTSAAGYQASEDALKAEGGFDADLSSVYINTFAHFIVVSKQVLSDEKQLQQTLGDLFRYRVLEFFERQVVIGTGVGRNVLGLATAATASGATGGNAADRIGATGSLLTDMGWMADLVIMNPNDWHTIRSERADTGNGQYLSGGWAQPAQPSIWSMPVVTTSSLTVGTAIVMDSVAALILDREAPTVLISSEDRDNFVKNMVTILAEMRGGLAILNPSAILSVALTP